MCRIAAIISGIDRRLGSKMGKFQKREDSTIKASKPGRAMQMQEGKLEKLKDSTIKGYTPGKTIEIYHDGGGLYLYVRPSGTKSWVFVRKLNGKRIEKTLGLYPDKKKGIDPGLSLAEARRKSTILRQKIENGINPIEEARQKAEAEKREALRKQLELERPQTIEALFLRWKATDLEHSRDDAGEIILNEGRKDEGKSIKRMFEKDVFPIIGSMHPLTVQPEHMFMIRDRMMKRGVGRLTNQCLGNMRQMFVFAFRRKFIAVDPTYGIKIDEFGGLLAEKPGERWLKENEVTDLAERLWKKHPGCNPFKRENQLALLLLVTTGCRIGEVTKSQWKNIHWGERTWHLPKEIRKGNRKHPAKDHDVYLSDLSWRLLEELKRFTGDSVYLFPSDKSPRGSGHSNKQIGEKNSDAAIRENRLAPPSTSELSGDKSSSEIARNNRAIGEKNSSDIGVEKCLGSTTISKQVRARVGGKTLSRRAKGNKTFLLSGGPWTPHDLRRTASTLIAQLATKRKMSSPEILAEKILSHENPDKMQRVYQHFLYDEEMKIGWELLSQYLTTLIPRHVLEPWPITKKTATVLLKRREIRRAREAKEKSLRHSESWSRLSPEMLH